MYTQAGKHLLLVAVARSELRLLTDIVFAVDPQAFIMISDLRSVLGEGFDQSHSYRLLKMKGTPGGVADTENYGKVES